MKKSQCWHCGTTPLCKECAGYTVGYNEPVHVCKGCKDTLHTTARDYSTISKSGNEGPKENFKVSFKEGLSNLLHQERGNRFLIKTDERDLWLSAETPGEFKSWVSTLKKVIEQGHTEEKDKNLTDMDKFKRFQAKQGNEIPWNAIKIVKKVAEGAFGDVFKARLWGTDVAVKTLKMEEENSDLDALEELRQEIEILSKLRHPNIVLYIGACTTPPNVCIVTEWCDRGSLFDVIHSNDVLTCETILRLSIGVARGMNYLHSLEHKIIHRDLKSQNILLGNDFQVKIADFGLSKVRTKAAKRKKPGPSSTKKASRLHELRASSIVIGSLSRSKSHTQTIYRDVESGAHYGVFGTPQWMAPEVMEGEAYTQMIDIYGYGVVLCELLYRIIPYGDFEADEYDQICDLVLDEGVIPTIPPWANDFLAPLIRQCVERKPKHRPSFNQILLRLVEISLEHTPEQIFVRFDIPRITHDLYQEDRLFQSRAALELSLLPTSPMFRGVASVYGKQDQLEKHELISSKVAKNLIYSLNQSFEAKQTFRNNEFMECLIRGFFLFTDDPTPHRQWDRERQRKYINYCMKSGVAENMMKIIMKKRPTERVKKLASQLVIKLSSSKYFDQGILTPKNTKKEMEKKRLMIFTQVLKADVESLSTEVVQLNTQLEQRLNLLKALTEPEEDQSDHESTDESSQENYPPSLENIRDTPPTPSTPGPPTPSSISESRNLEYLLIDPEQKFLDPPTDPEVSDGEDSILGSSGEELVGTDGTFEAPESDPEPPESI